MGANILIETKLKSTCLHFAASEGYYKIVKMLLDYSKQNEYAANLVYLQTIYYQTPLHLACHHLNICINNIDRSGHLTIAYLLQYVLLSENGLVSHMCDVDFEDKTPSDIIAAADVTSQDLLKNPIEINLEEFIFQKLQEIENTDSEMI
jgi:ankyrin repeat protein